MFIYTDYINFNTILFIWFFKLIYVEYDKKVGCWCYDNKNDQGLILVDLDVYVS